MIEAKAKPAERKTPSNKLIMIAIILVVLFVLGLYGFNVYKASRAASFQPGVVSITQSALEKDHGLRVQLLAVTAAGGLVDLRLQIVDADKAKALLSDSANLPALRVGDDVILRTDDTAALQDIQIEKGKSIFYLYPNSGNTLKPGDLVNIIFGDLQVEAIQAK